MNNITHLKKMVSQCTFLSEDIKQEILDNFNDLINSLIDMMVQTITIEPKTNHTLLAQKRDMKMIKSAGGSGYCVY